MSLGDSKKIGFLGQTLFRTLFLLITLSGFIIAPLGHPQATKTQLSDLEAFIGLYPDVEALLADAKGLHEYRELLKSYMGYNHEFDPIFETTIEQMRILVRSVPNFGEQIWANQAAGESEIKIEASSIKRSGVETKSSVLESRLEEQRTIYATEAAEILSLPETQQLDKVAELARGIQKELHKIEAKYSNEIKNPSRMLLSRFTNEQREFRQQYIHKKRAFFQTSKEIQILHSYLKYKISADERWRDRYRSPFAEDSIRALTDLHHLTRIEEEVGNISLEPIFLDGLRFVPKDALVSKQQLEFEEAKDVIKKINKIKDAKLDAKTQAELHHIQHDAYYAKKNLAENLNGAYQIPLTDQKDQLNITLRNQNSKDMVLRPARAFHAAFAGHQTKECVGGATRDGLTPRRWALSALKGVRTYLAEKGGAFDGALRLVKVEFPVGSNKYYDDVDAMLKSIDSMMEIRSTVTGQSAKYPAFDAILDKLTPSQDSSGFIAGDGKAVSQNTGLAAVHKISLSVMEAEKEEKTSIRPVDHAMETAINNIYTETPNGYNPGGMIYEAMGNDGKVIFHLKPLHQRRKYSKVELEEMLLREAMKDAISGHKKGLEKSVAWYLAVENDVRLEELSNYRITTKSFNNLNFKRELLRLVEEGNSDALQFIQTNASDTNIIDQNLVSSLSKILHDSSDSREANQIRWQASYVIKKILEAHSSRTELLTQVRNELLKVLDASRDWSSADNIRAIVADGMGKFVEVNPTRLDLITTDVLNKLIEILHNTVDSEDSKSAHDAVSSALSRILEANPTAIAMTGQISNEFSNALNNSSHSPATEKARRTAAYAVAKIMIANPNQIDWVTVDIIKGLGKFLNSPINPVTPGNLIGATAARWHIAAVLKKIIDANPKKTEWVTADILKAFGRDLNNSIDSFGADKTRWNSADVLRKIIKANPKRVDWITADLIKALSKVLYNRDDKAESVRVRRYVSETMKTIAANLALPKNRMTLERLLSDMQQRGTEYDLASKTLILTLAKKNPITFMPPKTLLTSKQTQQPSCNQLIQSISKTKRKVPPNFG